MFTLRFNDTGEDIPDLHARHATAIRAKAEWYAEDSERAIQVVRHAGEDREAVAYIIDPDGTRRPPDGVKFEKRENCTRSEDGPPCFCIACRADRRAGRPATAPDRLEPATAPEDDTWQRFLDGTL